MAESSFHVLPNKRARHGFRYQLELKFETEEAFGDKMDSAKRVLAARPSQTFSVGQYGGTGS